MRRVVAGAVAVVALAACAARPEQVPGAAAPVTRTGSTAATAGRTPTPTPAPTTPSPTPSPTRSPTRSPSPTVPPVPTEYETLTVTDFGVTVRVPVPAGWVRTTSNEADRRNTDISPAGLPGVVLRVDVTAREDGTVADSVATARRTITAYREISVIEVTGVGDAAVDWTFASNYRGVPSQTVDRLIVSGPAGVAVLLRVPATLGERYLPVWERAVAGLRIDPG